MASLDECEQALQTLAARLAQKNAGDRSDLDRSLSCTLTDLDAIFAGRIVAGQLHDIRQARSADAQVKLAMTSDDLVSLVAGNLNLASAWASGRVKVSASFRDMMKLRSIF